MTLTLTISDRLFSITNIYASNQQTKEHSTKVADWIMAKLEQFHLVGGDFNDVMVTQTDRSKPKEGRSAQRPTDMTRRLSDMIEAVALTDVWKIHNPMEREFTHFSQVHGSLSRIDYFSAQTLCLHI